MAYSYKDEDKIVWENGKTQINADNLNKVNEKTADALDELENLLNTSLSGYDIKVVDAEPTTLVANTLYFIVEGEE